LKLFHCIVVMGAALGCGSHESVGTSSPGSPEDSGATDSAAAKVDVVEAGDSCASGNGQFVVYGCGYTGACPGTQSAPHGPADCDKPQQLDCTGLGPCTCNSSSPLVPTDCAKTEQFDCAEWTAPCGCHCNLDAPLPEAGTCQVFCHSYDPPVGCYCAVAIL